MKPTKPGKTALTLNKGETFLLERLPDVLLLEQSMTAVRQKYSELWEAIVTDAYPELTFRLLHVDAHDTQVGIGKDHWASPDANYPSGFYVYGISFENLCSDEEDPPHIGVWIKPKHGRAALDRNRARLQAQCERILGQTFETGSSSTVSSWHKLPEPREQLLNALVKNGGQDFAEIISAYLRKLSPLIPIIDTIFRR